MRPPRHLVQLSILKGRPGILDIDTQLNFLKTKWFKCFIKCILRLLNPTNALWRDLMLYWLNLILNPNQGLVPFRQTQIFRSTRHKNLRKLNNDTFLYSGLILALISPITNLLSLRIWKSLEPSINLHPHTKLNISSNNPYFYSIPPKKIKEKFTINRDLQPCLISYTRFEEKVSHNIQ